MEKYENIDNHSLIYNGLEHIEYELNRSSTSYFRGTREAHQVLYRSLIEALKGTANLTVTGKPRGNREHRYRFDCEPIKKIHKKSISGCRYAWRFSSPTIVQSSDETQESTDAHYTSKSEDFLIPFYDALAMIQSECFMLQFVDSQTVDISDQEMGLIEWLHERIRNEYEHFIPKSYSAPIHDLLQATRVSLSKASACLFDSNNVMFYTHSITKSAMETKINNTIKL